MFGRKNIRLNQTLAKRGPDSNFVYEANIKVVMSKLNRSLISISKICVNKNVELYLVRRLLIWDN